MTAFWAAAVKLLISLIKTPLTVLAAFWAGKRSGRKDVEAEQNKSNLDAIADAEDARRRLKHDDDSLRNDPFNRHNT